MRHIKTYEVIRIKPDDELRPSDFIEIKYWRYKNDLIDCIMKLEKFTVNKLDTTFEFKTLILESDSVNAKVGNFVPLIVDDNLIWNIIGLEANDKILRPATEEEIEKFNLAETAKNYNV